MLKIFTSIFFFLRLIRFYEIIVKCLFLPRLINLKKTDYNKFTLIFYNYNSFIVIQYCQTSNRYTEINTNAYSIIEQYTDIVEKQTFITSLGCSVWVQNNFCRKMCFLCIIAESEFIHYVWPIYIQKKKNVL